MKKQNVILAEPVPAVPALKSCDEAVDIVFVVGTSSTIDGDDNFRKQINFIKDVVSLFKIGRQDNETKVAAVSFSSEQRPQFGFNQYHNKSSVLQAIDRIPNDDGNATRTYLALQHVHNTTFADDNGERPGAKNVVVLLTNGGTNPGGLDHHSVKQGKLATQQEAIKIKNIPATVFVIGIGNETDREEIYDTATQTFARYTIFVDDFGQLDTNAIKNKLVTKVCNGQCF